jgi:2-polyprenyl-6-methoxyphenol hydroxylase-like FAD-dependent oxidoreductase
MVGTLPARGTTLLVGDAAGLVNPLQGEGITQALRSGSAAARALLGNPGEPADYYKKALARDHLPYHRITSDVQRAMVTRPGLISAVGRVLTAPVIGRALASGWGLYWNELLEGSAPGFARTVALCAQAAGSAATARTSTRRWFDEAYGPRNV